MIELSGWRLKEGISVDLPLMRNDTDVAPQQHMFKRVSSSGVLLLMDEGGGGMHSMVCVLKMESDGKSIDCGTDDRSEKQHITRRTSRAIPLAWDADSSTPLAPLRARPAPHMPREHSRRLRRPSTAAQAEAGDYVSRART